MMQPMRAVALLLFLSSAAWAQEIYKWVDANGVEHFTDDPAQIPKGVKKQKTTGAEVGVLESSKDTPRSVDQPKPSKKPSKTKQQWQADFKEARDNIKRIEKEIAEDAAIVEPAGLPTSGKFSCYSGNYNVITRKHGPHACGLMMPDEQYFKTKSRLASNRSALKKWQDRLRDLDNAAANEAIPFDWRE